LINKGYKSSYNLYLFYDFVSDNIDKVRDSKTFRELFKIFKPGNKDFNPEKKTLE
jgi:hypothetical protein